MRVFWRRGTAPWLVVVGMALACAPKRAPESEAPGSVEPALDVASPASHDEPTATVEPTSPAATAETAEPPEGWPADLPWVGDTELDRSWIDLSDAGDVRVGWTASRDRFAAIGERFARGLADAAYVADAACVLEEAGTCVFRLGQRVATVSVLVPYPDADEVWVQLHLRPVRDGDTVHLPGKCVVPPQRARPTRVDRSGIDQSGNARREVVDDPVETRTGVDLDGDGYGEVFVPRRSKGRCPWEIPHDVYVMRGACGHRVGTIVGEIAVDQTSTSRFVHGLREVITHEQWARLESGAAPIQHTRERHYTFDGRRLRVRTDDETTLECHHCPMATCEPA